MSYKDYDSRILVAGSEEGSKKARSASQGTVQYSVKVTKGKKFKLEVGATDAPETMLGEPFMDSVQSAVRQLRRIPASQARTPQEEGNVAAGMAIMQTLGALGYGPDQVAVLRVDAPCSSSSTSAKAAWNAFWSMSRLSTDLTL